MNQDLRANSYDIREMISLDPHRTLEEAGDAEPLGRDDWGREKKPRTGRARTRRERERKAGLTTV